MTTPAEDPTEHTSDIPTVHTEQATTTTLAEAPVSHDSTERTGEIQTPRHTAYVAAVVDALAARHVLVTDLAVRDTAGRDTAVRGAATGSGAEVAEAAPDAAARGGALVASMTVAMTTPHGALMTAQRVWLGWTDRDGWSLSVRYEADPRPRRTVHFGVTVLPPPRSVAEWVAIALTYPELIPTRDDGPFTTSDLDTELRTYITTTLVNTTG